MNFLARKLISIKKIDNDSGFTFVEMVMIVGILVILLTVLFIVINPSRQYEMALDKERQADVSKLTAAIEKWFISSSEPSSDFIINQEIPQEPKMISSNKNDVDLCHRLVPEYINGIPFDAVYTQANFNGCEDYYSGYNIVGSTGVTPHITIISEETGYYKNVYLE